MRDRTTAQAARVYTSQTSRTSRCWAVAARLSGYSRPARLGRTEQAGGVAESLQTLAGYFLAAEVDTRWLVLDGSDEFSAVT